MEVERFPDLNGGHLQLHTQVEMLAHEKTDLMEELDITQSDMKVCININLEYRMVNHFRLL